MKICLQSASSALNQLTSFALRFEHILKSPYPPALLCETVTKSDMRSPSQL